MPMPRWGANYDDSHAVHEPRAACYADHFWRTIVTTVLRLIADAGWSDDDSTFLIMLIFASLGLLVSLLAAFNGLEIADV
jgi:hypothetical protein